MERNMTTGNPLRIILLFSIPIIIGNIFQQLYNTVDTVIVGQFVGTKPLAAVGATGAITFLILGLQMGMTQGFNVVISQKYGAKDYAGLRRAVCSGMTLTATIAMLLTVISLSLMKQLLMGMNTPEDIFQDAYRYVSICCGGMILTAAYNMFSGLLRAVGNSKVPLYALIFSAFLNVVLDLILTIPFHMGVAGTAYATVLAQGVSAILCFVYMRRKIPALHYVMADFRPDWSIVKAQIRIGLPMGLQFSFTSIGSILVQRALNEFGAYAIAANTAASKVDMLSQMLFIALGAAISTYAAQNMGAKKLSRIREGFAAVTRICIVYAIGIGVVLFFFGSYATGLFVSENLAEVAPLVQMIIRCNALFLTALAIVNTWRNGIQGMGFGWMPMIGGVLELIGRSVMAYSAIRTENFLFIGFANSAAWVLAGSFFIGTYIYLVSKLKKDPSYT